MQDYKSREQLFLISKLFEAKAKKYVLEAKEFPQAIEQIKTVLLQIEAHWQEFESFEDCKKSSVNLLQFLELLIVEIQEQLMLLAQTFTHVVTIQLQIEYHYELSQKAANYCQQKVQLEWQEGNENLAMETLLRRKIYLDTATLLKSSLEQQIPQLESVHNYSFVLQNWLFLAQQMKDMLVVECHEEMAGISSNECWCFDTGNQQNCFVSNRFQLSDANKFSGISS